MQTGTISFCGTQGLNIKSKETKLFLNEKLERFGINILKKHFDKYSQRSEEIIARSPHFVSLKSNGNPYLLFLTRYNDVDTCIFVDKKIQHGYFLPRMIIDRLSFNSSLFEHDTIVDGEMVKVTEDKWVYLMNDLFVYKGKKMQNVELSKRISMLHRMLKRKYFPLPKQKYSIQIKKYFETHDLERVYAFKDSLDYTSRGIQYVPCKNRFKTILMNFDDSLITDVKRVKYSSANKFLEGNTDDLKSKLNDREDDSCENDTRGEYDINTSKTRSVSKSRVVEGHNATKGQSLSEFALQKTDQPDVYKVYETTGDKDVGIASVSTMKTSKMLREVFRDVNLNEKITFLCEFSTKFEKWIPIERSSREHVAR